MRIEITDLDQLRAHRDAGGDLRGALLVGLDLTAPENDDLLRTPLDGAVLLGCELNERSRRQLTAAGGLLFPTIPDLPYQVYRTELYTPDELFYGFDPLHPESYVDTPDARVYQYTRGQGRQPDPLHALAERLHDHALTTALTDTLAAARATGRGPAVAVMGGHALSRDSAGYRAAVELGVALGRSHASFTVLTGGGPGAMEAVPLGVRLADRPDDVPAALRELATAPRFGNRPEEIGRWIAASLRLGLRHDSGDEPPRTIGIPTWFFGHEPPNAFQIHAKYFANSVREDGLLTIAGGGIVYTPGSAGTMQEVFQDYTQNHYATLGPPAPMIFLGREFWTRTLPAAPLIQQLSSGREAERWITVTDDVDEVVATLEKYAESA